MIASIHAFRRDDDRDWPLLIYREDLSGLGLPSRREEWTVVAPTRQRAHQTVDYHFGRSVLWYSLAAGDTASAE